MNVIKDVANNIDPMIQMMIDVPTNYDDRKVPMLDLKVWLDSDKILYQFYEKPTKSRQVMMKSSAMPMRKKMETLTQGVFRRLHNTHVSVKEDVKTSILNKYMEDLKLSGYDEKDRYNVLVGGFKTIEKLNEKVEAGKRPFFRPRNFDRQNRKKSWRNRVLGTRKINILKMLINLHLLCLWN